MKLIYMYGPLTTVRYLPPGALFETTSGTRAIVTSYRSENRRECYLVDNGSAAHFEHGDDEPCNQLFLSDIRGNFHLPEETYEDKENDS